MQQRRRLAAIEALRQFRAALLAKRGGEFFPDSTDLIREMREDRTRELIDRR